MGAYVLRRILYGFPIVLGVTGIVFLLLNVFAPDPVVTFIGKAGTEADMQAMRVAVGLDRPLLVQYLADLKSYVTFDFGRSWETKEEIGAMMRRGAIPSLSLTVPALSITTLLAIVVGMLAAFFRGRPADRALMTVAVLGMSVSFLVYIVVLQYLLAFRLPLFHIFGYEGGAAERWQYLALPMIILVIVGMGYDSRFYRSVFAEEVTKDHVTTALAKGAGRARILFLHVLKNALVPIITRVMISVPFLVTGSLLLESFFGIPGLGSMLLDALNSNDWPVIKAYTVMISILFVVSTIINDILYAWVDPRVRLE
jgi:peptide/nickel transport system permease protein